MTNFLENNLFRKIYTMQLFLQYMLVRGLEIIGTVLKYLHTN